MKVLKVRQLVSGSWAVSWPMTLIMFFVFLIGLADVYVAGRISKEIQAAYGLASQFYFILGIVGFALTAGSVSVVSRLSTADRRGEYVAAIDSSLTIALASGLAVTCLGLVFSGAAVRAVGVPEVLKGYAAPLIRIYVAGICPTYFLVASNGILRSCGMIRRSMATMAVVCTLNAFLNFFFAFHTPLGYRGIAVATVLTSLIGCAMNIFFLRRVVSGFFAFSASAAARIVRIGWPMGLLQVFWQLAAMALYLILAALPEHNIEIMAAFTNGLKIEAAIFLPAFAFNLANAVVVGNLLGKKNQEDAYAIGLVTAGLGVAIVTALTLLVMVNGRFISGLLSPDETVVRECVRYIYIALLSEPVMAWAVILSGGLNGAGDTRGVMIIVALCMWLVRVPASYVFAHILGWGAAGVWWAMNLSLLVQSVLITRRYFRRQWLSGNIP